MIDLLSLVGGLVALLFSALIFADGVFGYMGSGFLFKDVNDIFKIFVGFIFLILIAQNYFAITIGF
ncbi:hypothetical protein [Methanonatronarchaeum sp. AMET-Sl]|uniref:hypothetical protein n=1 Tax=Methanonatronarchaeum sp. AMET-Sl TaxID=3037654 RepID=UPI00244DEB30|nr:hypothetical protein [Methanonatronarchaeum sp. AMET-Sl]WGI17110.1 hypothetical protein QEN48_06310 [Methanonatronarchaeum sp. AMET-Sl]